MRSSVRSRLAPPLTGGLSFRGLLLGLVSSRRSLLPGGVLLSGSEEEFAGAFAVWRGARVLSDIVKRRSLRVLCAAVRLDADRVLQTLPALSSLHDPCGSWGDGRRGRRFAGVCLTAGAAGVISKQAGLSVPGISNQWSVIRSDFRSAVD
jgi:hypothetical protein